jgi:hypothetical protein
MNLDASALNPTFDNQLRQTTFSPRKEKNEQASTMASSSRSLGTEQEEINNMLNEREIEAEVIQQKVTQFVNGLTRNRGDDRPFKQIVEWEFKPTLKSNHFEMLIGFTARAISLYVSQVEATVCPQETRKTTSPFIFSFLQGFLVTICCFNIYILLFPYLRGP